ncbi:MAG: NTP transferase domain-containing protein [Nitrospinae bacterium]|nr:NTP transferase domain-containing protein [Nitrospinota bacterium]
MSAPTVTLQAILQARVASTRLPGKIFEPIGDKPLLGWVIERLRRTPGIERIVIATSTNPADARVVSYARALGIPCVTGPEEDVLRRFVIALDEYPAAAAVRATADNPLLDPETLGMMTTELIREKADWVGAGGAPLGSVAEVASAAALRLADAEAVEPRFREHVTTFIHSQPERFKVRMVTPPDWLAGRAAYRLTVDTREDLALMRALYAKLAAMGQNFNSRAAVALLDKDPDLRAMNGSVVQKNWRNE